MSVETVVLSESPVEETSEFVAALRSRRSATVQPQVEGVITRVAVRSGDRVAAGALLFEVDSQPQQAGLQSQQALRAVRASEVAFAQKEATRVRTLFEAGAASQRDAEMADTALRNAQDQLKAADEQVRQQRAELAYYKVAAPAAGVVGDIPVNVGDRVTKSTVLTTLEENDALEVYVNVPVTQARGLKPGLRVRIVDDAGQKLAENAITFVSPSVDDATQTVLAKARVVDGRGRFRADQFVRALVVWRSEPGLTIPVTAVTRVNGQYFAYLAEKDGAGLVARQHAVELGDIQGNAYVVRGGLKPGEQLIVAGLQKIGDGAPVSPAAAPPASKSAPEPAPTKGS